MSTYYVNNAQAGTPAYPVGLQTTGTCEMENAGDLTEIKGPAADSFASVSAGDPFWVADNGDTDAYVGMYVVAVKVSGQYLQLDRNIGSGVQANITCRYNICDGSQETASGANGPWPTLYHAVTNATAGDTVHVKYGQVSNKYTFSVAAADGGDQPVKKLTVGNTGSIANNTHIYFKAYHTATGDMDPGGTYCGTAMDYLLNNRSQTMNNTSAKWAEFDANDLADDLILINGKNNIHFQGFKFHNNSGAGNYILSFSNSPDGTIWERCVFDNSDDKLRSGDSGGLFTNCYFGKK